MAAKHSTPTPRPTHRDAPSDALEHLHALFDQGAEFNRRLAAERALFEYGGFVCSSDAQGDEAAHALQAALAPALRLCRCHPRCSRVTPGCRAKAAALETVNALAAVAREQNQLEDLENELSCALASDACDAFVGLLPQSRAENQGQLELEEQLLRVAALQWAREFLRRHVALVRAQRGGARFTAQQAPRVLRSLVARARAADEGEGLNPPPGFTWEPRGGCRAAGA